MNVLLGIVLLLIVVGVTPFYFRWWRRKIGPGESAFQSIIGQLGEAFFLIFIAPGIPYAGSVIFWMALINPDATSSFEKMEVALAVMAVFFLLFNGVEEYQSETI